MLLSSMTQAFGVSGYEKEVRNIIKDAVMSYADDISVDSLGNLIVFKKGISSNKKKIMLAAHMDEIGIQVVKIDEKGLIKFKSLGGNELQTLYMNRVRFRNGVTGIISSLVKIEDAKKDLTKLYVDIGVKTRGLCAVVSSTGIAVSHYGYLDGVLQAERNACDIP